MHISKQEPRFGKVRIKRNCFVKQLGCSHKNPVPKQPCIQRAALEIKIIRFFTVRHAVHERRQQRYTQRIANRRCNTLRDSFLKRKYVIQRAIEALGPNLKPCFANNEMGMNANSVTLPLHRPFDQVRHPQRVCNALRLQIAASEME